MESKNESLPAEEGDRPQKPDFESLLSQVDKLESELELERKKHTDQINRMKYLQADLINLQRQSDRLVSDARNEVKIDWIMEIISIMEDLQRAIKSSNEDSVIIEGLKLLLARIDGILKSEGVEQIMVEPGAIFDPKFHDAISFQETDDKPEGSIVSVITPGYTITGKVIRPVIVEVARKGKPQATREKEADQPSKKN